MNITKTKSSALIISLLFASSLYASGLPGNISELVDDAAPAVVNITSKREVKQGQSFGYGGIPEEMLERFGIPRQYREAPERTRESISYGSGFILKDNYILTNYHVVKDATEVIVSLLAIRDGVLPPTTNYDSPDPDCDLDYVPNVARESPCQRVLSNSFGFGGQNISLILSRFAKS